MPKIPSQASINSQMRALQRRAESQMKSEMRKIERNLEHELKGAQRKAANEAEREVKKWQRDTNRKLQAARPTVTYTVTESRYLSPIREEAAAQAAQHPERCDVFLCHAWSDREGVALEFCNLLESYGLDVWFSEKDVELGVSLIRAIDKGLRKSKIGLVLVTPALLASLENEGVADKELSALLATDRVIPVVHDTDFDTLREYSPLLASRSGLSTAESSLSDVAVKIANTVSPLSPI